MNMQIKRGDCLYGSINLCRVLNRSRVLLTLRVVHCTHMLLLLHHTKVLIFFFEVAQLWFSNTFRFEIESLLAIAKPYCLIHYDGEM